MPESCWILVQHSGYRGGFNPMFRNAVEEKAVAPAVMKRAVEAGGLGETSYMEATQLAEEVNYPPGTEGLAAKADGHFEKFLITANYHVDLFIPNKEPA